MLTEMNIREVYVREVNIRDVNIKGNERKRSLFFRKSM